jgi:HlyD family secretion protein
VFEGRVTQISPIGVERDNVTTFEVEVSIDNPGKELKANMTANAEIVIEEMPESLLVPEAAVTYDAQRNASVNVVDPGSRTGMRSVPVKVGAGNGTRIQILSGVEPGTQVVLPS